jgi:site-specific recombinase XerD
MYRMIFATLYAAGLRISEACALRPEHIDSKRKLIRVVGKGNKERCTLLSPRLLRELRDYWRRTAERTSREPRSSGPCGRLSGAALSRCSPASRASSGMVAPL